MTVPKDLHFQVFSSVFASFPSSAESTSGLQNWDIAPRKLAIVKTQERNPSLKSV